MTRKQKSKTSLQRELHAARDLIEDQSAKINSMMMKMAEANAKADALFPKVFSLEIEIARLNGYIDRVREVEGRPAYEMGQAHDAGGDDSMDYSRG